MSLPFDPLAAVERACIAEEVASMARHDLRNRLASIRNATFYLKRRVEKTDIWESDTRVPQFFGLIDQAVVGADEVVEQRLRLAGLRARAPAPVSLRACVDRAVACARVGDRVRFEIDVRQVEIDADTDEVALAIRALLENAAEASPEGAAVRVVSSQVAAPTPRAMEDEPTNPNDQEEGWHELLVRDDGPGIPEAARGDVTRAFVGDKPGHPGLGLAMAARIARRYKGEIVVGGGAGGAAVALVLPVARGTR